MFEIIAILLSSLSVLSALASFFAMRKVQNQVNEMQHSLASKYNDLPPSPDIEDPEGSQAPVIISDVDEKDH